VTRLRWLACGLLLAATAWAQANLDDVVARTLATFDVPGMSVGIVQDGKVILAKGYGVRKLGDPSPVTGKTLFGIASNTKAFTAAALAMLVDEKKIQWDERVIDVLPWFQMSDPYVSREMRIRDLLVHRSGLGLGAGDLMIFPDGDLSAQEILKRLRYVPLATSFRSKYAYDNILYIVAGAVIEQASGKTWAQFIEERIFKPLGMTHSRTNVNDVGTSEDLAWPHAPDHGKLRVVERTRMGSAAPAGAIQSSVEEMLTWVGVQLNRGEYPGGRLFSAAQSNEMWTPHIFMPVPADYPKELAALKPNFQAYALGWVTYDRHGERIVYHTGGLNGMVTRVTLVPSKKLGIVVLTNQQEGSAFNAVTNTVLDHYLGIPPTDWVTAYNAVRQRQVKEAEEKTAKAAGQRDAASKPSLPLGRYAGRYRDPWYGDVVVEEQNGRLRMRFTHSPALTGTMEHFQFDTFVVRWDDRSQDADAYVTFSLNASGQVELVKMKAVSDLTDFSYDFHDLVLTPAPKDSPAYD
jgi:CubicO group peptidase (beta-lactamase class C family)